MSTIRRSTIMKNVHKNEVFKRGVTEKREWAKSTGTRGLSEREFIERLRKEGGYDPNRRRKIMDQVLGEKPKGFTETQKRRNIMASRRTAAQIETGYADSQVGFGAQKLVTRSRVYKPDQAAAQSNRSLSEGNSSFPGQGNMSNPPAPATGGIGPRRFL